MSLKDTVRSFKEILSGAHDSLPESAFYMVRVLLLITSCLCFFLKIIVLSLF